MPANDVESLRKAVAALYPACRLAAQRLGNHTGSCGGGLSQESAVYAYRECLEAIRKADDAVGCLEWPECEKTRRRQQEDYEQLRTPA